MKTFKTFIAEGNTSPKELRHLARHFQTSWFVKRFIETVNLDKFNTNKSFYFSDKNNTYINSTGLNALKVQLHYYLTNNNTSTSDAKIIVDSIPSEALFVLLNNVRNLLGLKQLAGIK